MTFDTAVCETRERQTPTVYDVEPEVIRRQLALALGRINDEISVSEMCRGFVSSLLDQVTALSGYSELLLRQASEGSSSTHMELAERLRSNAERLAGQMSGFLCHPYFEARSEARFPGQANACIEALSRILLGHRLFTAGGCRFSARGTTPDLCFSANPIRVITGLRHLVEYCAMRVPEAASISLQVGPANFEDRPASASVWQIQPTRPIRCPSVAFTVATTFDAFDLVAFQQDLQQGANDPCTANLWMLAAAIADEHMGFEVTTRSSGTTAFRLYAPQPRP